MKEYNKDFDLDFSPMSDETISWLDELLMTCKHFNVDYYNASEKDRAFVEAVARKNYGLKQAYANGKTASTVAPFFGIHRAGWAHQVRLPWICSTTNPQTKRFGDFLFAVAPPRQM